MDCHALCTIRPDGGSEAERAAGVAPVEHHRRAPPLAVDADGEPVAAAVDGRTAQMNSFVTSSRNQTPAASVQCVSSAS